jgi:hypothetical protein
MAAETLTITINGFYLKGLGNAPQQIEAEYGVKVQVLFIRNYSDPPLSLHGWNPPDDIKEAVGKIIESQAERGLLVDDED